METKLDRPLDSHLEGVLEAAEYKAKKDQLLVQKVLSEQQIVELKRQGNFWLEPMKEFLLHNKQAKILANRGEPAELRAFLKNIGSNFLLKGRKLGYEAKTGWSSARDFRSLTDWYIEKETNINEEIDRLRNAATRDLLTQRDVIIVASVSCIYGLGNPIEYRQAMLELTVGQCRQPRPHMFNRCHSGGRGVWKSFIDFGFVSFTPHAAPGVGSYEDSPVLGMWTKDY